MWQNYVAFVFVITHVLRYVAMCRSYSNNRP
jgi:hypothetical protein